MSDAEKEVAGAEPDDHEEGEITDDEEVEAEPSQSQQELNDAPEGNNYDGGRLEDDEGEENEEEAAAAAEAEAARRARRERKKAKKDKERKRHRDRDREKERELDSDEEKKRRLKKKLAALEMQMQEEDEEDEDDEAMGIYANGGSPTQQQFGGRKRRRRRPRSLMEGGGGSGSGGGGEESSSDGGGGLGGDGERSPERKRKKSRERRRERRADKRRRPEKSSELCQLFMMGKCPKVRMKESLISFTYIHPCIHLMSGASRQFGILDHYFFPFQSPERCIFSHDAQPPQIFELCKFYLFDRCAKKEKCLYLHKGFPCKYFHTGHRCMDTAESCKFSHEPLNEDTRTILLKHLEAAPKEILGDFPRMSREQALNLVCKTECENKGWASHPLMDNKQPLAPPQQAPPQQQQPGGFGMQQNAFGSVANGPPPVDGFNNPPRPGGFDQGQPLQPPGGFPHQPRGPPSFRPREDGFAPPAPGDFGRDGGMDYGGPPQTPGLLGPAPPQSASIQERLVQLSGGMMNQSGGAADGRPQPQPLMGVVPEGDAAPGPGGERRRKSRWENQEPLPLPPPSLLQHPGATFRPPLINNQPFNNRPPPPQMGPVGPPQQPPPQGHRLGGVRPADPGFMQRQGFDQADPRNGRNAVQRMGSSNEEDPDDAGQRTPPNTEPNPFADEFDPFNPASEDAEPPNNSAPSGMPKAQQRLYERIQEKQMRERSGSPSPRRDGDKAKQKPRLNEGWYSSDEDNSGRVEERASSNVSLPKELTDVISSLRKSPGKSPGQQDAESRGSRDPRKRDPRRDPRRNSAKQSDSSEAERERDKRILEMDLGSVFGDLDLPISTPSDGAADPGENDMGLPFKPHVVASVAKEIDASIYSHSPLLYRLKAIAVAKPDYSDLVTKQRLTPAQSQDPRLRRYATAATGTTTTGSSNDGETGHAPGYNPGQDLGRVKRRDPRRRD